MSVPMTTLTRGDQRAPWPTVSRIAAAVCSLVMVFQKRAPAALGRGDDHGGQRDEDEQAEPDHRDARARGPRPGVRRAGARPTGAERAGRPAARRRRSGHSGLAGLGDDHGDDAGRPRRRTSSDSSPQLAEVVVDGEQVRRRRGTGRPGRWRPRPRRTSTPSIDRAEALEGELLLAVVAQHEVEPVLSPSGRRRQDRARVLDEQRGRRG